MIHIRKLLHILLAAGFALFGSALGTLGCVVAASVLFIGFFGARIVGVFKSLRLVEPTSFGDLFFACGVAAAALLFVDRDPTAFQAGMLALGFADPLAALVGKRWGTTHYMIFGEVRTREGALACAVITAVIFLTCGVSISSALLGGITIALVEAFSVRGADNLTIPLVAGAFIYFLA